MNAMIIVRHGEIYTKSEPVRRQYINRLVANIVAALPDHKVRNERWRIVIEGDEKTAVERLKTVFGIISFSVVTRVKADIDTIKEATKAIKIKKGQTFGVHTHRLTKELLPSNELSREIGGAIQDRTKAKVDLDDPDVPVNIEIYKGNAYIFTEVVQGPGGMPLGTGGRALALTADEDGVLAAWLMMKRGVRIICVGKGPWEALHGWDHGVPVEHVDGNELYKTARESRCNAVVLGTRRKKVRDAFPYFGQLPAFVPLTGYSDTELGTLREKVFKRNAR